MKYFESIFHIYYDESKPMYLMSLLLFLNVLYTQVWKLRTRRALIMNAYKRFNIFRFV